MDKALSDIFTPLVPGLIGAGFLRAIGEILEVASQVNMSESPESTWTSIIGFFSVTFNIYMGLFAVLAAISAAKVFKLNFGIGAAIGGLYIGYAVAFEAVAVPVNVDGGSFEPWLGVDYWNFFGMHITDPADNWFTVGITGPKVMTDPVDGSIYYVNTITYAHGGIIGSIFSVYIASFIYEWVVKWMPKMISPTFTPTLTIFLILVLDITLIFPITGYIFQLVSIIVEFTIQFPLLIFFLAFIHLWLVVLGVHQIYTPIYAMLVQEHGINSLYPMLAMPGTAIIGVLIAVMIKTKKDSQINQNAKATIVPIIFGIGEPAIYAVCLPKPKLLLSASLGGAIAAFYLGFMQSIGFSFGLSSAISGVGILAIPMMMMEDTSARAPGNDLLAMLIYAVGYFLSIGFGFLIAFVWIRKKYIHNIDEQKQLDQDENNLRINDSNWITNNWK